MICAALIMAGTGLTVLEILLNRASSQCDTSRLYLSLHLPLKHWEELTQLSREREREREKKIVISREQGTIFTSACMYYLWLEVLQTCERVSSPLSSLQKALFGSPDTNTRNKVPLKNKVLLCTGFYMV